VTSLTYGTGGSCSSPPYNLGSLTYTYDADGRRTATAGSLATVALPANVAGGTSTAYNADNSQTKFNGTTHSYDTNGNLTGDGTNTYTWDARNHLTAISGGSTASFVYDGFGRRMKKVIGGTTTQFVYDGLNPVQELNSSSGVVANVLNGLSIDERFSRTDSSGNVSTFVADALGSTVGLVGSAESIATSFTYQPSGATTVSGSANGNSYEFTGRENDGAGLYYYRARYYSPTFQRFIAQDPLDFAGGDANLYRYVVDNPTNYRDPSGRGLLGAGIGAVVGGIEGYEAARLQGQCGWDAAISAGIGAVLGGAVGALDPTEGVLTVSRITLIGGIAGGLGDIAGQLISNGGNIDDLGPNEIIGATVGGAAATGLGFWGAGAASSELGGLLLGSWAGAGLGTFGGPIGAEFDNIEFPLTSGDGGSGSPCGCSS
jgi:RHS repeat-associated protein